MQIIKAINGQKIKVDDEDYPLLSRHRWVVEKSRYTEYPRTTIWSSNKSQQGVTIPMHRLVFGPIGHGKVLDHINADGMDNQRHNLRSTSQSVNLQRSSHIRIGKSGYRGVMDSKCKGKRWRAAIKKDKKYYHLGHYKTKIEAAEAYDLAAIILYGRECFRNFPKKKSYKKASEFVALLKEIEKGER